MNSFRTNLSKHFCLLLFCATVIAFPTENINLSSAKNSSPEAKDVSSTPETAFSKESQTLNASSISTTSSLLFKDKKPILTYLLGQPKKQGSVSSPAQLLSPDRYEFFTFDDDGQIVKKLMSVKEIQKIIANTEKGSLGEYGNPIEYYQILTVTPDVESIPSVSRINPNEPLFSIHDVIASVQNVLKSEIKIKQSQASPDFNNTHYLASASSDQIEILTENPENPLKAEVQKVTSSSTHQTNPSSTSSIAVDTEKDSESSTIATYRPTLQMNTFSQDNIAITASPETIKLIVSEASSATPKPVSLAASSATIKSEQLSDFTTTLNPVFSVVSSETSKPLLVEYSSATSKPITTADLLSTHETIETAASTNKVITENPEKVQATESLPLSLSDAHPGLVSNETFLDMKPFTVEQISRIAEPIIENLKEPPPNPVGNFVKVETLERNSSPVQQLAKPANTPALETSTSKIQIPITPDLADSVSSVLWQIASENSMLDNVKKSTEPTTISAETKTPETIQTTEEEDEKELRTSPSESTTEIPAQSRSTVKVEKFSDNPLTTLQNILRTQNRPRPFQKIPIIEKGTPDKVESKNEPFSSSTSAYELLSTISSTVEISSQAEEADSSLKVENKVALDILNSTDKNNNEESVFTTAPPTPANFVISVSPGAVVQSPEQLKPVMNKVITSKENNTNTQNQTKQTIEGVQVIQEASIGQIPRTTEFPGQVVKEILRTENSESGLPTEETLSDSASNAFSTQLPYTASEATTLLDIVEGKTEKSVENENENLEVTTISTTGVLETKSSDEGDQKESFASERVDITFVPMVIKTPSEFKQEALLKSDGESESKEKVTTTEESNSEKVTDQTEVTLLYSTEQSNSTPVEETLESKELPESASELKNNPPQATTEVTLKETGLADDLNLEPDLSQIGTLKQNIPSKPYFTKPQKPVYIKPVKTKPQDLKSPKPSATGKPFLREPAKDSENKKPYENHLQSSPSVLELDAAPDENLGLEATVANLDEDIKRFSDLCNELAFSLWSSVTHNGLSFVRSVVISPFAVTSLLAMVFLGARGPTSGQMNDVLKLDEMVTFNPHLVFRNVTESLVISRNPGVATTAFVRELYSDKSKGKLLDFYKERVQQFYDGHVEEVNFKTIGDTLRRQTNHLVKRQTWGKITDFLRGSNLMPKPPLAAFSANIFQTDCSRASTKDRDGEMYFVILPASRLRRLVPVPAVVWRDSFLAGYEPNLDATAVSINPGDSAVSTIFVLPGQQGLIAPGDTLARLEHHLLGSSYKKGHWSRLMRSLLPRPGLELQIPRLSHKSVINVTSSLQRMGLKDLFSADKADLTGLNGLANDLHLSDMLQVNLFSTCGEEPIGARHHSEIYPATPILRREKSADNVFSESVDHLFAISDFEDPAISALPLELRPRQARVPLSKPGARIPEPPRLRFDRPFLFFVRHNPTGLILHMGRFNPRLMP